MRTETWYISDMSRENLVCIDGSFASIPTTDNPNLIEFGTNGEAIAFCKGAKLWGNISLKPYLALH